MSASLTPVVYERPSQLSNNTVRSFWLLTKVTQLDAWIQSVLVLIWLSEEDIYLFDITVHDGIPALVITSSGIPMAAVAECVCHAGKSVPNESFWEYESKCKSARSIRADPRLLTHVSHTT